MEQRRAASGGFSRDESMPRRVTCLYIKIVRRNLNSLRYTDDTTLMAESEEELESLDEDEKRE